VCLVFAVLIGYFSGIIFSSSLSDPEPGQQIVYRAEHVIDDLVVDPETGAYLYWTAYDAGFIARLSVTGNSNSTSHDVIVSSLTSPRALVIDVINRSLSP